MVSYAHKSTIIFRCATDKVSSNTIISNSQKDYIMVETKVRYSRTGDESRVSLEIIRTIILEAPLDFIEADQEQLLEGKVYKQAKGRLLSLRHQRSNCQEDIKWDIARMSSESLLKKSSSTTKEVELH
ncbi:unnamed protein product [Cuscuta europaea]|uniref:Uncharacterized protein n=1 Tax=Cuscuta europaea TaxID=41803 RepID=A0A9P0Z4L5_CUSEU|nr:unnamed protein product [Cuscuta europaea]